MTLVVFGAALRWNPLVRNRYGQVDVSWPLPVGKSWRRRSGNLVSFHDWLSPSGPRSAQRPDTPWFPSTKSTGEARGRGVRRRRVRGAFRTWCSSCLPSSPSPFVLLVLPPSALPRLRSAAPRAPMGAGTATRNRVSAGRGCACENSGGASRDIEVHGPCRQKKREVEMAPFLGTGPRSGQFSGDTRGPGAAGPAASRPGPRCPRTSAEVRKRKVRLEFGPSRRRVSRSLSPL